MLSQPFRVLVGFDHSSASQEALRLALDQASEHPLSQVHVVQVLPRLPTIPMPETPFGYLGFEAHYRRMDENRHAAHTHLRQEVAAIFGAWVDSQPRWIEKVEVHTRVNSPARGILKLAEDLDVDLVAVGTGARGPLSRLLFGSVARRVMHQSTRPVLVAHSPGGDSPAIEPPCPECTQARFETAGKKLWCSRHGEHHFFGQQRHYAARPLQPEVRSL